MAQIKRGCRDIDNKVSTGLDELRDGIYGVDSIFKNIGVIPGAGAAVRLTRWMGRLKAKEILMLGEFVSGSEAVQCGLANRAVPAVELPGITAEWAAKLATKAPLALAAAKACVNVGAEAEMPAALEYELREFLRLFDSEDQKEGMNAFLEKRPAKFTGR